MYNIVKKINSLYGFFGNVIRKKIPYKIKSLIFNGFIRSHIIYSAAYINNLNKTNTNILFKTLRRMYKYIFDIKISKKYLTDLTDIYIRKFVNNTLGEGRSQFKHTIYLKNT